MQPPVKHIVQNNLLNTASAANQTIVIAKAVLVPDPYTNNTDVKNANRVFAISYQIDWTPSQNTPVGDYLFDFYFAFNINAAQPMPVVTATGASHINNQVFHEDGAIQVVGAVTQSCVPHVWRGMIKIPRQWNILNDGDQIEMHYTTAGPASANHDIKYKFIYKEVYP